jgi:hypothetical protein
MIRLAGYSPTQGRRWTNEKSASTYVGFGSVHSVRSLLVPRDSLFDERIVWQGRPEVVQTPAFLRALAAVAIVMAAISLCFAAVIAVALAESPAAPLAFTVWCIALGMILWHLPRRWLAEARYVVTDSHVIAKYGPFSRSIERGSITFARIFWNPDLPNTGDLEIVRAVPTGALRRRLRLRLSGLLAPDRVWAIIRGAEAVAPAGQGERSVGERLDQGERILWTSRSRPTLRAFIPHSQREWVLLAVAAFLLAAVGRLVLRGVPALAQIATSVLPVRGFSFVALVSGMGLAVLLLLAIAAYVVYDAVIRPGLLAKETRYLVTDKRVLIQRRSEELHLDRRRIIDVIDTPSRDGFRDVFLVLDGPRARAVATSGAFGELGRGPHLRPVFESVDDAESISRILRGPSKLPHAA